MIKKSSQVLIVISSIVFIIGLALGIIYFATGHILEIGGENYFVGHVFKENMKDLKSSNSTESLATVSLVLCIIGAIVSLIIIVFDSSGLSVHEKSKNKRPLNSFIGGLITGIIIVIAMMFITPKIDQGKEFSSPIFMYVVIIGLVTSLIFTISGMVFIIKSKKKENIKVPVVFDDNSKDEF